jgi:hypothetical protein
MFGGECQQATPLGNGKVLILGGTGVGGGTPPAELYDPATGTFTPETFPSGNRLSLMALLEPSFRPVRRDH